MSATDIAALRARLARAHGSTYWRSLEEIADSPDFRAFLEGEWPRMAEVFDGETDRRSALKLLGAGLLMGGLAGCSRPPEEEIVPYVRMPENVVPGNPTRYATALVLGGYATGVVGETHTGRPTRVEGNPDHPVSRGATTAFQQASILDLYDPDRSGGARRAGGFESYDRFLSTIAAEREGWARLRGRGLRVLTGDVTSPSLRAGMADLKQQFPEMAWHVHEPFGASAARAGAGMVFDRPVEPRYRFAEARVVLALDGDFLGIEEPGQLAYARDLAEARRVSSDEPPARLYAVESTPGLTGTAADHRLAAPAGRVEALARYLANALGVQVAGSEVGEREAAWLDVVARDLRRHEGHAPVATGAHQPPAVHALVHAVNAALGNIGTSVDFIEPVVAAGQPGLDELAAELAEGEVDTLLMLDTNPVLTAPADLGFADLLANARMSIHLGPRNDETGRRADWHIPQAHDLESWGDACAFDGTVSIQQPLVTPLMGGRTPVEVLGALAGVFNVPPREFLRGHWQRRAGARDFEGFWRAALERGTVENTAAASVDVEPRDDIGRRLPPPATPPDGLEVQFRPDPAAWDGRFVNNGWLQELPRPLTKLVWANAALISPALAENNDLASGDVVRIQLGDRALEAPAWIMPGQPREAVTLPLGYGRDGAGRVAEDVGFDAYPLRTRDAPWFSGGARIVKTGRREELVTTQDHHAMEGRDLVRAASWRDYVDDPEAAHRQGHDPAQTIYRAPTTISEQEAPAPHQWGMVIDFSACIGCNACVVACQSENNIPIVGPDQVARGREMHWLRIDRYYAGDLDDPRTVFQPVTCMHCENAPCEYVCPVGATQHSSEGLNDMIYNRCIGTRYCSQNCPYKVRRFNWTDFTGDGAEHPVEPAHQNPDVTVRGRGVMEKCTYCVQRINRARIAAGREDRAIGPDEVTTACQDACPTRAITFGDIANPDSAVARLKQDPRDYGMLAELNTRPRTTYLAAVGNPNPEIEEGVR